MIEKNQKPEIWKLLFGSVLGVIVASLVGGGLFLSLFAFGFGQTMDFLGVMHLPTEEDLISLSVPTTTEVNFPYATDYSVIQNASSRAPSLAISVTAKETGEVIPISNEFDARIYYEWDEYIGGKRKAVFVIPEPGVYIVEITSGGGVAYLWPFIDQNSRRSRLFRSALLLAIAAGVYYFIRSAYRPRDRQVANDKAAQWKKMMDERAASQKK